MPDQRRLSYFVASSLDGFIAGPDGSDPSSWWPMTDDYLDFIRTEYPETLPGPARQALGVTDPGHHFDTVVEGRRSFEIGLAAGLPNAYPHLRHLVVSTTLESPSDSDVEIVSGDPIERIRQLKDEPGKGIWLVGGGTLAASLRPEIDELIIKLGPVTLGSGIPLWGHDAGFDREIWSRAEATSYPGGMTLLRFERAGDG
ncbi:MAG: dihydrofolate reductase family protein [Brevibacterium aurantiacum]|uniref:dihydrofolate reductase family protein n=1 Tax=Brevibacterium aurantiacum TaxID=273384 RepID=UPI003F8DC68F